MESKEKRAKISIGGMTCISCQNKIEKKLRNTEGVKSATVSYSEGTADVTYDTGVITFKDICAIIGKLGYKILTENEKLKPDASRVIGILIIIVSLYVLLQQFGILNLLVPSQLADARMGYGMLFVIGLITSIHCVAMCGGINLSQCIPHDGESDSQALGIGKRSRFSTFTPAFLYNLGRVISYTVVGFILGFVSLLFGGGSGAGLPVLAQGIIKLIAGVFMVIMGINMLGIFPWLRKLQPQIPKFLERKVNKEKSRNKSPLIVGLLNGLMPCGPLQSMQIVALASGNPFAGAISMFLFSLGTVPLMLGLGSIVSALGKRFTQKVMGIGAVLVVVLGLAMLSQGGSLSGLLPPNLLLSIILGLCVVGIAYSIPFRSFSNRALPTVATSIVVIAVIFVFSSGILSNRANAENVDVNIVDGKQVVTSTLSSGRYPNIAVQVGTPVKWVINAPKGSINGCNDRVNIQAFGISNYQFKPGENVIEFNPTKTGKFQYSCWMGMIRGTIIVTDAGTSIGESSDDSSAQNNFDNGNTGPSDPVPAGYKIPTDKVAVAKEITYKGIYPMQEVTIELTDEGFSPAIIVVKSGLDVKWNINNSSSNTEGGTQLLVPNYATQLNLSEGENSLSFTPDNSFDFSTGDNKYYGYLSVVDDVSQETIASIKEEISNFQTLIWPPQTFQQNLSGSDASGQAVKATEKDGVQYVTSSVSGGGYEPIQVQKGIPVKWTLKAPEGSLNGCNNAIVIPEYNLQIELKTGDNLIEFTPDKSGTFAFSCWMGMVRSNITVANDDGTVDATEDDGSSNLPSCCG